jgi:hypothetical protein
MRLDVAGVESHRASWWERPPFPPPAETGAGLHLGGRRGRAACPTYPGRPTLSVGKSQTVSVGKSPTTDVLQLSAEPNINEAVTGVTETTLSTSQSRRERSWATMSLTEPAVAELN